MNIAQLIDHTNLKAEATPKDIASLCEEALRYQFAAVCVNPHYVRDAMHQLQNSKVKVCTVVGFPLGANCLTTKLTEAAQAVEAGASEIDMVINIGALKYGGSAYVQSEIRAMRQLVSFPLILKVIIESAVLTNSEIRTAAILCVNAGADFVKTSTGMHSKGGAKIEHVELIKRIIGDKALIKASGGIKNLADLHAFVAAGANRIGTSSGVNIMIESLQG